MAEKIKSADELLSRQPTEEYVHEWTELVKEGKPEVKERADQSLLIFRIQGEWLALATEVFSQITENKFIHKIPSRTSKIVKGIVNIDGQIRISVSLKNLLDIPDQSWEHGLGTKVYSRNIVIEKEECVWVFPVDEVYGMHQCNLIELENVPVNIKKSSSNYLRGVLNWKDNSVGLIDHELLFYSLARSL